MSPPLHPHSEQEPASDRLGLLADWSDFVFLHFALPPVDLAPHVPFAIDPFRDRAYVSLVAFRMKRLRLAGGVPSTLGRLLMRPFSEHLFLNLQTYVRGPHGPGVFLLGEWLDNPLFLKLGQAAYGLPCRRGQMFVQSLSSGGLRRVVAFDEATGRLCSLVVPTKPDAEPRAPKTGSAEAFLLERWVAYTERGGLQRSFAVRHPSWTVGAFQLARTNTALIEQTFPWFARAEFVGGHLANGSDGVFMGPPTLLGATARDPAFEMRPSVARP